MNPESTLNKTLGLLIKEHRKNKGLTQSQLAEMAGLSTRHIGKLEDGTYSPKLSTYLKISEILDFDISDMKVMSRYAPREEEARILFLLKKMDKNELKISYNFLKAIMSKEGEGYA